MLKLEDNPPVLFPDEYLGAPVAGRWWVGHTKARFEKAFAWDLLKKEIPYFLPMIPRTRISGGRKRRTLHPLFTSYVFFRGEAGDRTTALSTGRLCQVIEVHDQKQMRDELAQINRILTGEQPIDFYPFAAMGQRCRISRGPLQGLEGTVIQRDGGTRFVVQVSILGQGAAVEVEPDFLEEIGTMRIEEKRCAPHGVK